MPPSPQRQRSQPSLANVGEFQPRSSARLWAQGRQRRAFMHHLTQWSLNHDSSPYFQGRISLLPQKLTGKQQLDWGQPVECILTDTSYGEALRRITIRLFPPQTHARDQKGDSTQLGRRDSMGPLCIEPAISHSVDGLPAVSEHGHATYPNTTPAASGYYELVVRCDAGWVPAREYFSKVYFTHLKASKKAGSKRPSSLDSLLYARSQGYFPFLKEETITIRPLFRPFLNLPLELRDLILSTAVGLSLSWNLCCDQRRIPQVRKVVECAPISLATMFRISRAINQHLVPYVYRSTDFEFGLTGFTQFLWQSGPVRRPEIRRLTFHFGSLGLLHCIRWLAPEPIFSLFEPPIFIDPRSLQYFWRCQLQDLSKDIHLLTLTVNITEIPSTDLPMVAAILSAAFGSVDRVLYVETDPNGNRKSLDGTDERLKFVGGRASWRDMCRRYYATYRSDTDYFKAELDGAELEDLDETMDVNKEFFDSPAL